MAADGGGQWQRAAAGWAAARGCKGGRCHARMWASRRRLPPIQEEREGVLAEEPRATGAHAPCNTAAVGALATPSRPCAGPPPPSRGVPPLTLPAGRAARSFDVAPPPPRAGPSPPSWRVPPLARHAPLPTYYRSVPPVAHSAAAPRVQRPIPPKPRASSAVAPATEASAVDALPRGVRAARAAPSAPSCGTRAFLLRLLQTGQYVLHCGMSPTERDDGA